MKIFFTSLALLVATSFHMAHAQSTTPSPYCVANFDDQQGFPVADAIFSVAFGTLSNVTNAQYAFPHYVHYNNLSVPNFSKGTSYPLTVKFDVHGGAGYGVWIDYNHNNTFEPSEKVSGSSVATPLNISSNTIINQNITIPTSALTGNTRMRVRIVEDDNYTLGANGYSIQPCNASTSMNDVMDWGETEDYTINILASVANQEIQFSQDWSIYPNPTSAKITLKYDCKEASEFKVFNTDGKEVLSGKTNLWENTIETSSLSDGMYYFQLFNKGALIGQKKMVKQSL